MRKKKEELTKGEERILEIFWNEGKPLTSMEVMEKTDEFNESYVHRLLNSLLEKKALKVEGMMKSGKQYARIFVPEFTREEYGVYLIKQLGMMRKDNLKKFAVALTKENKRKEEVIETLEEIIDEIKGEE